MIVQRERNALNGQDWKYVKILKERKEIMQSMTAKIRTNPDGLKVIAIEVPASQIENAFDIAEMFRNNAKELIEDDDFFKAEDWIVTANKIGRLGTELLANGDAVLEFVEEFNEV